MVPGPPCQAVWQSPLVFAGTVIEVDQPPGAYGPRRVRFRITEAFRGPDKGEIDIHLSGGGGASCDPEFRMGESWLVYGNNRWEGGPGWTASTCSRTKLLAAAAEDLAYLRTPDQRKPRSHITGRVAQWLYDPVPGKEGRSVGIPNVPVVVTSGETRLEAKTDSDGRYTIPVESQRAYQVQFGSVEGLPIRGGQQVWLPHYLACAFVGAGVAQDARVSGQVVDDAGLPVAFLPIALVSSPEYLQRHTMTDAAGRFQFHVPYPGPHKVTPSTDLWEKPPAVPPLTPAPLDVPRVGHVDTGPLRMPSMVKLVRIVLLYEDSEGKPAAGAHVTFRQPDIYNAISYDPFPTADERGAFSITVVPGQRYEVGAMYQKKTADGSASEEATVVITATDSRPILIRLAPFR